MLGFTRCARRGDFFYSLYNYLIEILCFLLFLRLFVLWCNRAIHPCAGIGCHPFILREIYDAECVCS